MYYFYFVYVVYVMCVSLNRVHSRKGTRHAERHVLLFFGLGMI